MEPNMYLSPTHTTSQPTKLSTRLPTQWTNRCATSMRFGFGEGYSTPSLAGCWFCTQACICISNSCIALPWHFTSQGSHAPRVSSRNLTLTLTLIVSSSFSMRVQTLWHTEQGNWHLPIGRVEPHSRASTWIIRLGAQPHLAACLACGGARVSRCED